jgi:hypothetical protein
MRAPKDELRRLLPAQVAALGHVEELGRRNRSRALENLSDIVHQADVEQSAFDEAMVALRALCAGPHGNNAEVAKFWLQALTELKNCGIILRPLIYVVIGVNMQGNEEVLGLMEQSRVPP